MKQLFFTILFFLLFCMTVQADPLANANIAVGEVSVAVLDRSQASWQQGLQAAFTQELIQLSGNPQIMTSKAQALAKNAMQWVQSYEYVEQPNTANPALPPTLMLHVTFDSVALQRALIPINTASSAIVQTTSQTADAQTKVSVVLSHVSAMPDLIAALHALRETKNVSRVFVKEVTADQVVFDVTLFGPFSKFAQALSSDYRFRSRADDFALNNDLSKLHYSWVGNQT